MYKYEESMRKQVFGRQLGRTKNQRQALFRGLIKSLIEKGEIETTVSKAKAIRSQAEKMINKAKRGNLNDKRIILRVIRNKELVNKLVGEIAPLFKQKNGGYLKIVRTNLRQGDSTQMAKLMFTEELKKNQDNSEEVKKTTLKEEKKEIKKSKKI